MKLWPTHIRRACLCPRLFVDEYKNSTDHKIFHGEMVLPGKFFHDQVAEPIFNALGRGIDTVLLEIIWSNKDDQAKLKEAIWDHSATKYLTEAIEGDKSPNSLSADQILYFSHNVGVLSEILAEIIFRHASMFSSAQELCATLFLPPESKLSGKLIVTEGLEVSITGMYDALIFDAQAGEFVILEFKCKGKTELIGDMNQLASYAWLINETSGIMTRGKIIYLSDKTDVQDISQSDMESFFDTSKQLIHEMVKWISTYEVKTANIPATPMEDLCSYCPLDKTCDDMFGPRRISTGPKPPGNPGIYLGKTIEDNPDEVFWRPIGEKLRLPNGHMLIVGTSGSGKTQCLKALISELTSIGVTPLIFDFNNDYVDQDFLDKHQLTDINPMDEGLPINPLEIAPDIKDNTINMMATVFEIAGIMKKIYKLGDIQVVKLREAIQACYGEHGIAKDTKTVPSTGFPDFEAIENNIRQIEKHESLLARLSPIFSLGLFKPGPTDQAFESFISSPVVIRLAPLPTEQVKLAVVEFVLMRLYNHLVTKPHQLIPTRAIIIDEAHKVNSSDAVVQLFREIRKYGVAFILSSQKAKDFHPDIHSNAGTTIFLKTSESADRKYISEQLDSTLKEKAEIMNTLSGQGEFEAILSNDHYKPYKRVRIEPYYKRMAGRDY